MAGPPDPSDQRDRAAGGSGDLGWRQPCVCPHVHLPTHVRVCPPAHVCLRGSTCPHVSMCVHLPMYVACPPAHMCHVSTCLYVSTLPCLLGSCFVSWPSRQSGNSREGPSDSLWPRARLVARDPEAGRRPGARAPGLRTLEHSTTCGHCWRPKRKVLTPWYGP